MTNKKGFSRKWLIGGMATVTAVAGLVIGVSGPASADPVSTFVGVGSDTTQDVLDAMAIQVGGGVIGSYDAVNPGDHVTVHDPIAPKSGCTMTRPNGSGEGVTALRQSLGSTVTGLADAPEANCVDFARSSSGPGGNASASGQLIYIPFALDAVATATGPTTTITDANLFSLADLQAMYTSCTPTTPSGSTVQYVPDGTVTDATHQPIHLYVPQSGSGTRNFWLDTTTGQHATIQPCVHDHAFDAGNGTFDGAQVEEHDGTVYAGDAAGFGPFSIAQFVAQRNGHNDRRHGVVLHNVGGTSPCGSAAAPSSCAPSGTLNTAFPIRREVYNVVSFARVTSTAAADAQFVKAFSGSTSLVCGNSVNIINFGFALLNAAPLGHTCGQLDTVNLRAFATL